MAGNVVSAAVISGELIIGLDDGSIIRAGYVQGPQGLKGDRGPMGATGSRGIDGNTIHTVKGPPPADLGTEGDYAINNRDWFIFGPKASGLWGAGQSMLPKNIAPIEAGKGGTTATGGGGGSGSGGSSGPIYTNTVQLTAPTRTLLATTTGYKVLPPAGSGKQNQQDANRWAFGEVFDSIDQAIPVHTGELPPPTMPGFIDVYDGRLWFKTLNDENRLYIYNDSEWVPCTDTPPVTIGDTPPSDSAEGELWWNSSADEMTLYVYYTSPDGTSRWTPAAPPVSLDGINTTIATALEVQEAILERLDTGEASQATLQTTVADALTTQQSILDEQLVQNNQIVELEEEIESLAPSLDRGKWNLATLGAGVTLASGEYAMGIGVDSEYCQEKYLECLAAANNDPFEMSECTRLVGECETAKDAGDEYYINDWSHADFLHFHKTDSEGKTHTFNDYKVGMFIDLFDQGDTGYAVFEVTAAPTLDGDVYTIGVHPVQHEGEAAGLARVKVFELSGADPTDYVRKTGDEMSGGLVIGRRDDAGGNPDELLAVKGGSAGRNPWFTVKQDGIVSAGYDYGSAQVASESYHVLTKKFVDLEAGPARLKWKVNSPSTSNPIKKFCSIDASKIASATEIKLNVQSQNSSVPFAKKTETWYDHVGSSGTNSSVTVTIWRYYFFEHEWIGTADVQRIVQQDDIITLYINHCKGNTELINQGLYFISVSGIF